MPEIWKAIPGHEGWYEASTLGRIRSLDRSIPVQNSRTRPYLIRVAGKVLKSTVHPVQGYRHVTLWSSGSQHTSKVSTLIALTFLGPRPAGKHVCHDDGVRTNDRLSNLYYGTPVENAEDKRRHGTHRQGESIPWAKLTRSDVIEIRRLRGQLSQAKLAKRFGVGQVQIGRIQRGERWRHVEVVA